MDTENSKIVRVLQLIVPALVLAGLFDYLFFEKTAGVSVLVFVVLLLGATLWLATKFQSSYRSSLWLIAPILFFAAMPLVRANLFLDFLNICAVTGLLLLFVQALAQKQIRSFTIGVYLKTIFGLPFRFLSRAVGPLRFLVTSLNSNSSGNWRRVLIGALTAVPVLIIFTLLFSSADLVFKQFINSAISLQLPDTFLPQVIVVLFVFTALLGALEFIFTTNTAVTTNPVTNEPQEVGASGGEIETGVFLSLMALLFLIFIGFQVHYLFGGEATIVSRGFTYAEYARNGFWELLAVGCLTLIILLFTDWITRAKTASRKLWFTVPASAIVIETLIIMASAFKRLMLYQDAYGMTMLRFYVAGFIVFLGAIFVLMILMFVLQKKQQFFAFGTLLTMITFLVGINFINPDVFIARQNIIRFEKTGKIDPHYLTELSADATSEVLKVYPRLESLDQVVIGNALESQQEDLQDAQSFWGSYNISRSKAVRALDEKF